MDAALKNKLLGLRRLVVDNCPTCQGHGYVLSENGYDEPCSCMLRFRYIKALVLARIPSAYWNWDLADTVIDEGAVDKVRRYLDRAVAILSKGMGLFFFGPNGSGKTTLMCEVGKTAIEDGYAVGYLTAQAYIGATQTEDHRLLDWVQSLDVVLFDELDKPYMKQGSSYVAKQIEELFRRTITEGQVFVTAANETLDGIAGLYGQSLVSAFMRRVLPVAVMGKDLGASQQQMWDRNAAAPLDLDSPRLREGAQRLANADGSRPARAIAV